MPSINVTLEDIPEDQPIRLEHEGDGIVVVRTAQGVSAFPDVCPHAQWRLSDGEIVEGNLECPGHSWAFNPATGDCVTVPTYCLQPLSVRIDDGNVQINWEGPLN